MKRNFIAKRFQSAGTGLTLDTAALAKYKDIVDLSIGDTDFTTDEAIINAAFRDAKAGHTHYGDPKGDPELISAVCKAWEEDFDQTLPRDHVLVSASSCLGMSLAMFAILNPGDEVIVFSPYFALYRAQIELAGGVCVDVPTYAEEDYAISEERLRAAITPRTKAVLLNSPGNPSGAVTPLSELERIADVCIRHDIWVISDEVYHPFVFDGSASIAPSIAAIDGMHERTVVVESLSKTFAMTGWRIGYLLGPEPLIEQTSKLAELMHSSVNSTAQYAAVAALTGPQEHVTAMREEYCAKRQIVLDELDGCTALRLIEPQGAFYAFVDVRACGMDCDRFSRMLLDEEHVAVVPGTAFGSEGAGFVRLSYAGDGRELREGVRRMRVFAERHVNPALGRHTPGYHHLQIMA